MTANAAKMVSSQNHTWTRCSGILCQSTLCAVLLQHYRLLGYTLVNWTYQFYFIHICRFWKLYYLTVLAMCLVLWLSSLFFIIREFCLIVCLICFFYTWLWLFMFNKHSVHFKWQYCSPFLFKRDGITGSIVNVTKFTGVDCSIPC